MVAGFVVGVVDASAAQLREVLGAQLGGAV